MIYDWLTMLHGLECATGRNIETKTDSPLVQVGLANGSY
jgi:hypothetical protein